MTLDLFSRLPEPVREPPREPVPTRPVRVDGLLGLWRVTWWTAEEAEIVGVESNQYRTVVRGRVRA